MSPVRRDIFTKHTPTPAEAQPEEPAPLKPVETERFKDTVIMSTGAEDSRIGEQLAQADQLFKNKKIKMACEMYENIAQTIAEGDSLDYEVRFMLSECAAENQQFEQSLTILKEVTSSRSIPQSVLEKSLVRLGQVNCVLDRRAEANTAFTRFKKEFPNSVYIKLATCEAVR